MAQGDDRPESPGAPNPRRPYAAPQIICSEMFPRGVKKTSHVGTPEYHTSGSRSTS
jgi:hypothetical protein